MQYVNLGRSGLKVSRLCLGVMTYGDPAWRSWVLPEEQGRPFIQRALEHGIHFFEERFASIGPLGRLCRPQCYPESMPPAPNLDRYLDSSVPAENIFDLKVPPVPGE